VSDTIIEFRQVSKSFNGTPVLSGMDLAIRPAETVTVIGGSGIGKSVTLKLIVGLMKPEAGQVLIEGEDIVPLTEDQLIRVRKKIGMVFQGGAIFDSLSVGENIAYPLREHTTMSEKDILDASERPSTLWGSMASKTKTRRSCPAG